MKQKKAIIWFRRDLRLQHNPALQHAICNDYSILPIYILDREHLFLGEAQKYWLHNSLRSLQKDLSNKLLFFNGNCETILLDLIHSHKIDAVFWNRCYEPKVIKQDQQLKQNLSKLSVNCASFNANLLVEPWRILKKDGNPYKVYSRFKQQAEQLLRKLDSGINKITANKLNINQVKFLIANNPSSLMDLNLLPEQNWTQNFTQQIGEQAAQEKLQTFLQQKINYYGANRDIPSKNATSDLAAHLHFGEISVTQIWQTIIQQAASTRKEETIQPFLNELLWREFSNYLLYHFPQMYTANFNHKFNNLPWKNKPDLIKKWQQGQTGYPIVDAGMRELWSTGYMHNRVRMITASFLIKNLLCDWRLGMHWFENCLLDANIASNSFNWQWVAGTGIDSNPYFRIFNPVTQGEKFDKDGNYTRKYVSELKDLPNKYLFKPWEAPKEILQSCGLTLGEDYPLPIVNLKDSRQTALKVFSNLKQ